MEYEMRSALVVWLTRITTVRSDQSSVRRRGRNVIIVLLGLAATALLSLPVAFMLPQGQIAVISISATIVVYFGLIGLAQRGWVTVATLVLLPALSAGILAVVLTTGQIGPTPFFFALLILIAGTTLPPIGVVAALAYALGLLALLPLLASASSREVVLVDTIKLTAGLFYMVSALVAGLSSFASERNVREAEQAQLTAEQASADLVLVNASLEAQVAERTGKMREALAAQEQQAESLQLALAKQHQLVDQIRALAIPIIPVRQDVLVVPLIGGLDAQRGEDLIGRVLQEIEQRRARMVIIDITGVPVVDAAAAGELLRTADTTRLLGATTVLVGIRPEVAQALVGLSVDLRTLRTEATLQQALEQLGAIA
jgi:anti-anti-sigma factor